MERQQHNSKYFLSFVLIPLFCLYTVPAFADLADADQAEDKARAAFVEHFVTFLQDKNVMGKVTTPDGKPANPGPNKNRFDQDDGISYRSDLTYHDFSFKTQDEQFAKKNEAAAKSGKNSDGPKARALPAFVSEHGGISEGGGSSLLERTVYGLHERFFKEEQDEKKQKQQDEEKGIKYKSVNKIETREVFKKDVDPKAANANAAGTLGATGTAGAAGGANKKDPNKKEEEPEKIERFSLRDEARPEIEKVGEQSFKTIERASRDAGFENDEKTLSNSTLLFEGVGRASEAWWNSTLANLGQRRVNYGMKGSGRGFQADLSEGQADCASWRRNAEQSLRQQLTKAKEDPKIIEQEVAKLKQSEEKCKTLSQLDYSAVDAKFVPTEDGKAEVLKTGDILKEDGFSRDLRNQLEVLGSAGKDVTKLKTNWKYDASEDKQEVAIGLDEQTGEPNIVQMSVSEQLESYNQQLEEAKKGFKEVKQRFPQLEVNEDEMDKFKIEPESRSVMEINRPTPSMLEDLGVDPKKDEGPAIVQTYNELVEKNQEKGK